MDNLQYKDKFDYILRDDEKVLWTGAVNKKSFILKSFGWILVSCLIPSIMIGAFVVSAANFNAIYLLLIPAIILLNLLIGWPLCARDAKNTYICITDKQIIKRFGIIKNDIQRIPLSSVNEIRLVTSWVDSNNPMSSTIKITTKGLSSSGQGVAPITMTVRSLIGADEAYKLISKLGDNESVKISKIN